MDEQESRAEDTSTAPSLLTVKDETQSHLTNGSLRCNILKHEKSVGEKLDGAHTGEKAVHPEKANGTAATDKSKKTRGEPPFTKQEREEMETLLHELCGHWGQCFRNIFFGVLYAQLRVCANQSFILPGFWKVKMLRRTFCSTQTSCCHYQYTTSHPHTAIEYHSQRIFETFYAHIQPLSDTRNSRRCLVNYRFMYLLTRANQRGVCSVESTRTVWYIVHKYTNTTDVKVLVIIIVD